MHLAVSHCQARCRERLEDHVVGPLLRNDVEILEVGLRRQMVLWRGEVVPDVTVRELALASAALRAQSFYKVSPPSRWHLQLGTLPTSVHTITLCCVRSAPAYLPSGCVAVVQL